MLSFNFNWERLSVSAGLTLRNFYFRLYPGAIGQVYSPPCEHPYYSFFAIPGEGTVMF